MAHRDVDQQHRYQGDQKPEDISDTPPIPFPISLIANIIGSTAKLIKPLAPHLVPLVVFILAIPVILTLSLSAGFFVWKSIAVGWETPLYLQYGCV